MTYQLYNGKITEVSKRPSLTIREEIRLKNLERVAEIRRPGYYAVCGLGALMAGALVSCWWYVVWGVFTRHPGWLITATTASAILTFPGIWVIRELIRTDRRIVAARRELAELRGPVEQVQGALSVCEGAQSAQGALSTPETREDAPSTPRTAQEEIDND